MIDGLWIIEIYDPYAPYLAYPKEAYGYLISGIGLTVIACLITEYKKKNIAWNEDRNERDNRVFINKIWGNRMKIADKAVGVVLITLVIIAIFNLGLAISLLIPIMCLGLIISGFIFIMHDDGKNDVDEPPQNRIMQLIDYRRHPFSLPLILFILIVVSVLLSNQFGFKLDIVPGGNPMYVISLPDVMYLEAIFIFTCGFIYIIHNGDFLGIHREKLSEDKLFLIHFAVIISSGSTFLVWLVMVIEALWK